MPKFMRVPQGKICRLLSTNQNYNGLYTDSFSSCNIIVLYNNEKISMIHADSSTDPKDIAEEKRWVGNGCKMEVYVKKDGHSIFERLFPGNVRNSTPVDGNTWSISAEFEGSSCKIQQATSEKTNSIEYPIIIRHPKEAGIETLHKLHVMFFYVLNDHFQFNRTEIKEWANNTEKLVFDGEGWILPNEGTFQLYGKVRNKIEPFENVKFSSRDQTIEIALDLSLPIIDKITDETLHEGIQFNCMVLGGLIWSYYNAFHAYDAKLDNEYVKIETERLRLKLECESLSNCQDARRIKGFIDINSLFIKQYYCKNESMPFFDNIKSKEKSLSSSSSSPSSSFAVMPMSSTTAALTNESTATANTTASSTKAMTPFMQAQIEKEKKLKENQELLQTAHDLYKKADSESTIKKAYDAYTMLTKLTGKENDSLIGYAYFFRAEIDFFRYCSLQSDQEKYMSDWRDSVINSHSYLTNNSNFLADCPLDDQQKAKLSEAYLGVSQSRLQKPISLNVISTAKAVFS